MPPKVACRSSGNRRASPSSSRQRNPSNTTIPKSKGGAPFRPQLHELAEAPSVDSAALSSLVALFSGQSTETTCDGCETPLSSGQSSYSPDNDHRRLCRPCAVAALVAKHKRCCLCNGRFGPGEQILQSPTDDQLFACGTCVAAMKAAAHARPSHCDSCKQAFGQESNIFVSRGTMAIHLCQTCAAERNAEQPLTCSACQMPFVGKQLYRSNIDVGKFLCEACKEASLPTCVGCGLLIRGSYGKLGNSFLHLNCIRCSDCSGKIAPDDGTPWFMGSLVCKVCRNERLTSYGMMLP